MAEAIPIVMSIAGAGMQFIGQRNQARAQERVAEQQRAAAEQSQRIAQQNAAAIEAETAEEVRRERLAATERQSARVARAAASGGLLGGSTGAYLEEQAQRESDYLGWLQRAGKSRADIAREQGRYSMMSGMAEAAGTQAAADATRSRATAGFATSLAGTGAKAADLWGWGPSGTQSTSPAGGFDVRNNWGYM